MRGYSKSIVGKKIASTNFRPSGRKIKTNLKKSEIWIETEDGGIYANMELADIPSNLTDEYIQTEKENQDQR